MSELLRIYAPEECNNQGYPYAWDRTIKKLIRDEAGNRCLRCGHPYGKGMGEWSTCDAFCTHGGKVRWRDASIDTAWPGPPHESEWDEGDLDEHGQTAAEARLDGGVDVVRYVVQAHWRVLTTHHLNRNKADCRWWNLVPLCQICHLHIQAKVKMDRPWPFAHTDWFQAYAAGFYAYKYLHVEITRAEAIARLDELLEVGMAKERENWVAP